MFKAKKWGWKQFATALLLAPVIGGWAGVAHAQLGNSSRSPLGAGTSSAGIPTSGSTKPGTQSSRPAGGDFKGMLKDGRKALAAGQFDRAQDLARAAEANNPTGKWGLFEDTPNSLLKDVQAAVVKAQKTQSEQMTDEAKKLLDKPTKNEAERAANLDRALQLAQRADQLHGPYSAWEFGDRPDKLVKEITTARGRIKNTMPSSSGIASKGPNTSGIQQAGGTKKPGTPGVFPAGGVATGTADAKKASAVKLMAEGRKLADQGMYAAARAKYVEADRLGATFGRGEPTPGFAMQELNTRGARAMENLVVEARTQIANKDFAKAYAALTGANEIATTLSLFPGAVKDANSQLWTASAGKFGTATPGLMAAGGPETLVPSGPAIPVGPVGPTAPVAPVGPSAPVATAPQLPPAGTATVGNPAGNAITGRTLLLQAENEYKAGDLDLAAKLALQAYNLGGVKDEASALLNSIDAERLTQKTLGAVRSFEAAQASIKTQDYNHALGVLVLIDPNLLPAASKTKHAELLVQCRAALEKPAATGAVATVGGMQEIPVAPQTSPGTPGMSDAQPTLVPTTPPGTARVTNSDPKPTNPDSYTNQVDALKRVQVQKLRADGLKIQSDALAAFGRGETDLAMQMLTDYSNRVRASGLEPASMAMLLRPIDSRLDMLRVMKGQTDALTRVNKESRDAKAIITERGLAEDQRRAEVQASFKKYHELVKSSKYAEAEKVALQAKQLDPDNPAIGALVTMAKTQRRVQEQEQLKAAKENMVYNGFTDAEKPGAFVSIDNPISVQLESYRRSRGRGSLDNAHIRTRTPAEYDIELKLDKPIPIEINQTPLDQAIDHLRDVTGLPISIDTNAIAAEGINLSTPISEKLTPVATRHILTIILEKAGLSYVVENDVVKVTTTKKAKGRLFTKVFSVADLVTPVPNFALPDYANFDKMLKNNAFTSGNIQLGGSTPGGANGLNGGVPTGNTMPGAMGSTPGIGSGNFGGAGQIQSSGGASPLAGSASLASDRNTKHEQLIKLITGMVRPYSWDGMGGPGRIEYFDIGSALVVNQVADVIQEVADLLEALRRLQDLAIAVEIRIVSLSETWYERLGVDFSMNIKTHTTGFEPALTQVDPNTGSTGVFRPSPYINDNNFKGTTVGLTPAGSFTGDLDVPIRPNTFNMAIPPFGGYPNTPGNNGGVAFGLAFLNDIQVFMFMEAAQGDRRVNVMQAPKLTLFNGQTATLAVTSTSFFVTNVSVISVNGQLVFSPTNTPLAGPDTNFNIGIQAVVSADRRFVRLNLPVNLAAQTGATVPLFPITTFITPVFEGGSQGIPIPFTQFLQQPSFTSLNIQTTVVCPDGGTVLLGGLKTLQEGRNEFGPPVLSKIPYLNRLFKNVGVGRETTHIMIMVTPRIIINSEEEIFQTEGRPPVGQP